MRKRIWSCDEPESRFRNKTCRNPRGCHCREIQQLVIAKGEAHKRGFNSGIAVAAAVAISAHGEEVVAQEIIQSVGMDTRAKGKRMGADDYDLDILKPVFRHINSKRKR